MNTQKGLVADSVYRICEHCGKRYDPATVCGKYHEHAGHKAFWDQKKLFPEVSGKDLFRAASARRVSKGTVYLNPNTITCCNCGKGTKTATRRMVLQEVVKLCKTCDGVFDVAEYELALTIRKSQKKLVNKPKVNVFKPKFHLNFGFKSSVLSIFIVLMLVGVYFFREMPNNLAHIETTHNPLKASNLEVLQVEFREKEPIAHNETFSLPIAKALVVKKKKLVIKAVVLPKVPHVQIHLAYPIPAFNYSDISPVPIFEKSNIGLGQISAPDGESDP